MELTIIGPSKITGVSDTPSRQDDLLVPSVEVAARSARAPSRSSTALGTRAYRRPLTKHDRDGLMAFYTQAAKAGGFEEGVRSALQAMLVEPVLRVPLRARAGERRAGAGLPDQRRRPRVAAVVLPLGQHSGRRAAHARGSRTSCPSRRRSSAKLQRMLADPRSEALVDALRRAMAAAAGPRQGPSGRLPVPRLRPAARRRHAAGDRAVLPATSSGTTAASSTCSTANYTFVNERLARHYGIPNVSGQEFRRVTYPDSTRRGHPRPGQHPRADVDRQPHVAGAARQVGDGSADRTCRRRRRRRTCRRSMRRRTARMATRSRRASGWRSTARTRRATRATSTWTRSVSSLDNFDVTGKWRYRENAMLLDTRGRPVRRHADARRRPTSRPRCSSVRFRSCASFTENLMAYALGRRVEDFDQPTIRAIAKRG